MNLGNLRTLLRFYLSTLTSSKASDTTLNLILNEGALDVAHRSACLKAIQDFDATAELGEYRLSSVLTRYLDIGEEGIWWYNDSTWEEIDPRTIKYLDNHFPRWRDDSSGDPQRYTIYGDLFIPHPKPDTTQSNGFRAYFIQRPPSMTADAHFPFPVGSTQSGTERSDLAILSDAILLYSEWKVLKAMNKRQESFEKRNEYLEELELKKMMLHQRRDIGHSDMTAFKGPRVG